MRPGVRRARRPRPGAGRLVRRRPRKRPGLPGPGRLLRLVRIAGAIVLRERLAGRDRKHAGPGRRRAGLVRGRLRLQLHLRRACRRQRARGGGGPDRGAHPRGRHRLPDRPGGHRGPQRQRRGVPPGLGAGRGGLRGPDDALAGRVARLRYGHEPACQVVHPHLPGGRRHAAHLHPAAQRPRAADSGAGGPLGEQLRQGRVRPRLAREQRDVRLRARPGRGGQRLLAHAPLGPARPLGRVLGLRRGLRAAPGGHGHRVQGDSKPRHEPRLERRAPRRQLVLRGRYLGRRRQRRPRRAPLLHGEHGLHLARPLRLDQRRGRPCRPLPARRPALRPQRDQPGRRLPAGRLRRIHRHGGRVLLRHLERRLLRAHQLA